MGSKESGNSFVNMQSAFYQEKKEEKSKKALKQNVMKISKERGLVTSGVWFNFI